MRHAIMLGCIALMVLGTYALFASRDPYAAFVAALSGYTFWILRGAED
jgi:hypothetical protein